MRPVIYVKHPVSQEKKRELMAHGYRILDVAFKPADAEPYVEPKADSPVAMPAADAQVKRGRKPKDAE